MALHLKEKVSRTIGDMRTIAVLVDLIDHELEKRIVARHLPVKIDGFISLLSRLKNDLRRNEYKDRPGKLKALIELTGRLRMDYDGGPLEAARDAMAGHSLQMDLSDAADAWTFLGKSTFAILMSDVDEIEAELKALIPAYVATAPDVLDPAVKVKWANEDHLGDPNAIRLISTTTGIATAGAVSAMPTMSKSQECLFRANSLMTSLFQIRKLIDPVQPFSVIDRVLAEILINDYLALWEMLFTSGVTNKYGRIDKCLLDYWTEEAWGGASALKALGATPIPDMDLWREQLRNKFTAHIDADVDSTFGDLENWPVSVDTLVRQVQTLIIEFRKCALLDVRSRYIVLPPLPFGPTVVGISNQEGKRWDES